MKSIININKISYNYLQQFGTGEIANQVLRYILEVGSTENLISKKEIEDFKIEKGSNSTFKLSSPLLYDNLIKENGKNRTYCEELNCHNEFVYMNNNWPKTGKVRENLIQWILSWINKNNQVIDVKEKDTHSKEHHKPFDVPFNGNDENCKWVRYADNVTDDIKVEGLCSKLEQGYRSILDYCSNCLHYLDIDYLKFIPVILKKECPNIRTSNELSYITDKINDLISDGHSVTKKVVQNILYFNDRLLGEFVLGEQPYIIIYYRQFSGLCFEEYFGQVVMTLAHEFTHYIEYLYCKKHNTPSYKDERVSEALADFLSFTYLLSKNNQVFTEIAIKRYDLWQVRFGSSWPYYYALYFLNGYNGKFDYLIRCLIRDESKFSEVFKNTINIKQAYKILIS